MSKPQLRLVRTTKSDSPSPFPFVAVGILFALLWLVNFFQ